jgi:hypothetical protein
MNGPAMRFAIQAVEPDPPSPNQARRPAGASAVSSTGARLPARQAIEPFGWIRVRRRRFKALIALRPICYQ